MASTVDNIIRNPISYLKPSKHPGRCRNGLKMLESQGFVINPPIDELNDEDVVTVFHKAWEVVSEMLDEPEKAEA